MAGEAAHNGVNPAPKDSCEHTQYSKMSFMLHMCSTHVHKNTFSLFIDTSVIIGLHFYTLSLIANITIQVNLIEILTITLWKNMSK